MESSRTLAELLSETRDSAGPLLFMYDHFVDGLRALAIGAGAPRLGEPFPDFSLPNAAGRYRSLDELVATGPLVLSFNRGSWCPYCVHELRAWHETLPQLRAAGGRFAAITPEIGGRASELARLLDGDSDVLCDVDFGVALASGLAFYIGLPLIRHYRERGLDLSAIYGSDSGFLPVPATFIVDHCGVTRYAFVDPDFRVRAEPAEVVAALAALG